MDDKLKQGLREISQIGQEQADYTLIKNNPALTYEDELAVMKMAAIAADPTASQSKRDMAEFYLGLWGVAIAPAITEQFRQRVEAIVDAGIGFAPNEPIIGDESTDYHDQVYVVCGQCTEPVRVKDGACPKCGAGV